ncbi:FAR1 DNA binding domain, Zinc finger, SWIM-type, MULE transposase domain, FHY3/FAR1 family [Artemisia annua]|uniref:FAR1 DNA binding domain, Zinc finger, SWIM-type, MULE transposase domain, FHY3/FAR1 family n=1 Tax=Artemisia annua TaxID=35608 RepID=A0A2U1NJ65_ARTAN|nr:FAR1 DNA binding domain, Zinc finger, SWIM-type, MULE transposase domain, FHY3/FAR1 family [Artemisia annua]
MRNIVVERISKRNDIRYITGYQNKRKEDRRYLEDDQRTSQEYDSSKPTLFEPDQNLIEDETSRAKTRTKFLRQLIFTTYHSTPRCLCTFLLPRTKFTFLEPCVSSLWYGLKNDKKRELYSGNGREMWIDQRPFQYFKTYPVGPDLAKDETFKRRISDIVWTDRIEPEEFEDLWELLLVDFDLKSHEWLLDMYNLRHKWIPAYYRNELMSGLMRTSFRSESENNAYGRLTSIDLTLWEFYNHFDSVVGCQKFAQRKNDHDSRYTIPDFHTELLIEKEASELYTRVSDVDSGKKYVIQDTGEDEKISRRHRIVKGKSLYDVFYEVHQLFHVLCKPSEEFYQCTRKHFESYGLLCRYIFYVIRLSKVKTFPRKYVLRRWSQDSLPPASVIQASGDTPDMILREIFKSVEYCVNRYANEPELLQKFRDHQVQLMAKADADVPIPKKTNKRDRLASILGVSQPEEIVVNIPKQVSTKGSRKRIKSSIERSMNPSGKRRKNCRFYKCECNAIRAQVAAKKASDKAAVREMKQKERLAGKKARLAEKNASVLAAKKARMAEKNACVVS